MFLLLIIATFLESCWFIFMENSIKRENNRFISLFLAVNPCSNSQLIACGTHSHLVPSIRTSEATSQSYYKTAQNWLCLYVSLFEAQNQIFYYQRLLSLHLALFCLSPSTWSGFYDTFNVSYSPCIQSLDASSPLCFIYNQIVFTLSQNTSKYNYLMLLYFFKLTTCFGPCTGPSSGHKIYNWEDYTVWIIHV